VGVDERPRRQGMSWVRLPGARKMLLYAGLALIPVVVLLLMVLIAHSR